MNSVSQPPVILITGGARDRRVYGPVPLRHSVHGVAMSFISKPTSALTIAADVEVFGRRVCLIGTMDGAVHRFALVAVNMAAQELESAVNATVK
jgi:hypothetical protein